MPPPGSYGPEERIISEEDRNFYTSLGNWTGDAVWYESAGIGFARFNFTLGHFIKTMTLSYPYVLLEANGTGTLWFWFSANMGNCDYTLIVTISDTKYSYQKTAWNPDNPMRFDFDTPLDWDRTKAYVQIQVDANIVEEPYPPPDGYSTLFWNFSIIESWTVIGPPTKPQYLPIMGIG